MSAVWSCNEWDPLEEVIVGRLDYATIPTRHVMFTQSLPAMARKLYMPIAGRNYPKAVLEPAKRELEGFVQVLEGEGIRVRRPEPMDFGKKFKSQQGWKSKGFCTASPRDGLMVLGDRVLETPMAWRSRYFEMQSYHKLLREYWDGGAG